MAEIGRSWRMGSWERPQDGSPDRIPRRVYEELSRELEGAPDDQPVQGVTAGMMRALLAPHERRPGTLGATITDLDKRVTYRATIGRAEGQSWIRTVEVIPHDDRPDPSVFRIPHGAIADRTAEVLNVQAAVAGEGDPRDVLIWGTRGPRPGIPTPEELRELVRQGLTRKAISELYKDKSLSRVDDWLREARAERPDLDWPPRRRGPKPGQTKTQERGQDK